MNDNLTEQIPTGPLQPITVCFTRAVLALHSEQMISTDATVELLQSVAACDRERRISE